MISIIFYLKRINLYASEFGTLTDWAPFSTNMVDSRVFYIYS